MHRSIVIGVVSAGLLATAPVRAGGQFFEGFDGVFENTWNTFPFPTVSQSDPPFIFFEGFPQGTFLSTQGASVFRMTNVLSDLRYVGMSPADYVMDGTEGIIEARINTLVQNQGNLDGFFTMRVVSPGGPKVTVGLFGDNRFRYGSTIDNTLNTHGFFMQDNMWYRVRFDNTGPALKAQLLTDGGQLISSHTFGHSLADLQLGGPGLYLEIVQDMITPNGQPTVDVAIDWVSVTNPPCPADLVPPAGLDIDDVLAFLAAFIAGDPLADVAPPFGVLDIDDVLSFLGSFAAGCP